MDWTTPSYEEIKMDAEIGSYQPDEERPPIVTCVRSASRRADDVESRASEE